MRIHTQSNVDLKCWSTFLVSVNFHLPSHDKELLAHLAWVLNAYLPAETVLKLLAGNKPIPHCVPLPQHLSPSRWKNLIALL